MLERMRALLLSAIFILAVTPLSQTQSAQSNFEVASVRPSAREVGPDYNNQIRRSQGEFSARNVTLRRLVAEAWQCQLKQVFGPPWLDRNEYDFQARLPEGTGADREPAMLRALLADRFGLKAHEETRQMQAYVLMVAGSGPKIQPAQQVVPAKAGGTGFRFHGTMREFADLLAVQFSIPAPENPSTPVKAGGPATPVIDKTGLQGVYDFTADVRLELGTDALTQWKRVLGEQLGLKIESRQAEVPVVVVDEVNRVPSEN
jgi:uncharacterized protein (TIGR03435 family)